MIDYHSEKLGIAMIKKAFALLNRKEDLPPNLDEIFGSFAKKVKTGGNGRPQGNQTGQFKYSGLILFLLKT